MKRMAILLLCAVIFCAASLPKRKYMNNYNFRASTAYKKLSASDRAKLESVDRDFVLLWGALDMYYDQNGENPASLDELVPGYLAELPTDPFATAESAQKLASWRYIVSKKGMGYGYTPGARGNRAWALCSVGLEKFPYNADSGNIGLYRGKGTWISGENMRIKP